MIFLFDDWKRFCFVLREIASGEDGHPLPSLEAQKRAQAVLSEYDDAGVITHVSFRLMTAHGPIRVTCLE